MHQKNKIENDDFLKQVKLSVGMAVGRELMNPDEGESIRHMEVLGHLSSIMGNFAYGQPSTDFERTFSDLMIYLFCLDPAGEDAMRLRDRCESLDSKYRLLHNLQRASDLRVPAILASPPVDGGGRKSN